MPAAALASVARPPEITLRPAEPDDVPAVLEAYRQVARAGTGLLERSGPLFDTSPEAVLAAHDGLTVAVEDGDGGRVAGYASWDRTGGYEAAGRLSVPDLVGLTAPATSALLAMLGSWSAVAPTIALRLPDPDPARLIGAFVGARIESHDHWMLRVLDAPAAIAARGWPPHVAGSADLRIEDETCPWNAGPQRLVVEGGAGRLEPGGGGTTGITARGLAVLYAGAASPALLRRAGLLSGGDEETDGFLAAATAGPAPALLDYF